MEDIFKSGLLGIALIGTLVLASANNKDENLNSDNTVNKIEETIVQNNNAIKENKLKVKQDIHIPQ